MLAALPNIMIAYIIFYFNIEWSLICLEVEEMC